MLENGRTAAFVIDVRAQRFRARCNNLGFVRTAICAFVGISVLYEETVVNSEAGRHDGQLVVNDRYAAVSRYARILYQVRARSNYVSGTANAFPIVGNAVDLYHVLRGFRVVASYCVFGELRVDASSM